MNVAERTAFYSQRSHLPRARVAAYRRTPVAKWSKTSDRKIGSTIRGLERMAAEPDLTWVAWRHAAGEVLATVKAFVDGVLDTVASFVERIARSVNRVLKKLKSVLKWTDRAMKSIERFFESLW